MDTSVLENIAEDYISHILQKQCLLVAKPKFDQMGTDLLVFDEIDDGVKFCRVQSKGRSFKSSDNTNIRIKKEYVTNGFLVFLYLEYNENEQVLYTFFPTDIQSWSLTSNDEYQLNLSKSTAKSKLEFYKYNKKDTTGLIKSTIKNAELHGEFKRMIYGKAEVTLEGVTGCFTGEIIKA